MHYLDFIAELKKSIEFRCKELEDVMCHGRCEDYAAYREMSGQYVATKDFLKLIEETRERMKKND